MTKSSATIIGKLSQKELQKRIAIKRKIKSHGKLLGTVILTDIKAFPFTWARVDIRMNNKGLYAIRNGLYVRPVGESVLKDKTFEGVN